MNLSKKIILLFSLIALLSNWSYAQIKFTLSSQMKADSFRTYSNKSLKALITDLAAANSPEIACLLEDYKFTSCVLYYAPLRSDPVEAPNRGSTFTGLAQRAIAKSDPSSSFSIVRIKAIDPNATDGKSPKLTLSVNVRILPN